MQNLVSLETFVHAGALFRRSRNIPKPERGKHYSVAELEEILMRSDSEDDYVGNESNEPESNDESQDEITNIGKYMENADTSSPAAQAVTAESADTESENVTASNVTDSCLDHKQYFADYLSI